MFETFFNDFGFYYLLCGFHLVYTLIISLCISLYSFNYQYD